MNIITLPKYKEKPSPLACYDCKFRYGAIGWCDVVIPDNIWELINPSYYEGAGILCFNCIARRLEKLGLENIPFKVTSGPFKIER